MLTHFSLGLYPIVYADLERYKELNLKTAKVLDSLTSMERHS